MAITYPQLLDAITTVREDGRTIDTIVVTEETSDRFVENMQTVNTDTDTDTGMTVASFPVEVGERNEILTERGVRYDIEQVGETL